LKLADPLENYTVNSYKHYTTPK